MLLLKISYLIITRFSCIPICGLYLVLKNLKKNSSPVWRLFGCSYNKPSIVPDMIWHLWQQWSTITATEIVKKKTFPWRAAVNPTCWLHPLTSGYLKKGGLILLIQLAASGVKGHPPKFHVTCLFSRIVLLHSGLLRFKWGAAAARSLKPGCDCLKNQKFKSFFMCYWARHSTFSSTVDPTESWMNLWENPKKDSVHILMWHLLHSRFMKLHNQIEKRNLMGITIG